MLYLDTITTNMHKVATKLHDLLDGTYYLAGGTALSLQIGHRESVDLDYFTSSNIDTNKLFNIIKNAFNDVKVDKTYEEINTLWLIIDGIKVSFIKVESPLIEDIVTEDVFKLASIKDILLMKLSAICGRSEYKDYYDLVFISKIIDARSWVNIWIETYKDSDPLSFIVALNDVGSTNNIKLNSKKLLSRQEIVSSIYNIVKDINKFLNL